MIARARTEVDEPILEQIMNGCLREDFPSIPSTYYFNNGCAALSFFSSIIREREKGWDSGLYMLNCFRCHSRRG